jgi:epoxyqueuosine reductase QueG
MKLKNTFDECNVSLWGIASLKGAVDNDGGYRCIAFGLPYDDAAVEALPDDALHRECKARLNDRISLISDAIAKAFPDSSFVGYGNANKKLNLRENGISQKVLAHLAGLGWIGRSSLIVTKSHGPRVRLGTLFTKDDLGEINSPPENRCGPCAACATICPSDAITSDSFDVNLCTDYIRTLDDDTACGLCMQACPHGKSEGYFR